MDNLNYHYHSTGRRLEGKSMEDIIQAAAAKWEAMMGAMPTATVFPNNQMAMPAGPSQGFLMPMGSSSWPHLTVPASLAMQGHVQQHMQGHMAKLNPEDIEVVTATAFTPPNPVPVATPPGMVTIE